MLEEKYQKANVWTYKVTPDAKFNPALYVSLIQAFIDLYTHFVLEIAAKEGEIYWKVTDLGLTDNPPLDVGKNSSIEQSLPKNFIEWTIPIHHIIYRLYSKWGYSSPFLYINDLSSQKDPLEIVINNMSSLGKLEGLHYYIQVRRAKRPKILSWDTAWDIFEGSVDDEVMLGHRTTSQAQRIRRGKRGQTLYECRVFIQANAESQERADTMASNLASTFRAFARTRPGEPKASFVQVKWVDWQLEPHNVWINTPYFIYAREFDNLARNNKQRSKYAMEETWKNEWVYLTIDELAALWHLPHEGFKDTNIAWLKTIPEIPNQVAQNVEGIVLGEGMRGKEKIPVRIPTRNRTTHMNVVGQTGSGKSTFLHNLIHQDIHDGKGVCVIDPHGTLVKDILRYSIPKKREKDVVLLDFGQSDYPLPFNLFALSQNSTTLGYIADIIEAITARHYGNTTGIQTSVFLKNALQVLGYTDAPTMRSVQKFLTDGSYRLNILEKLPFDADYLYDWWLDHYHERSDKDQFQISTPILTRIDTFIKNRHTYPSLCHPDVINIRKFVEKKQIVLVSLKATNDQMSDKDRDLIGALFIMMLQMFGMEESEQVDNAKFYVYVDEVQHFTTTALDKLFTEARKFGLSMTVANQYLGQLDTSTMDAIMNNVGATVAFGIGTKDATMLTPFMSPYFDRDTLVQMNSHEAAVRMKVDTVTQPAFWLKTYPPVRMREEFLEGEVKSREIYLQGISTQNHTPKSRQEVELWLRKQYPRRGSSTTKLEDSEDKPIDHAGETDDEELKSNKNNDNNSPNNDDDDFKDQFLTSS